MKRKMKSMHAFRLPYTMSMRMRDAARRESLRRRFPVSLSDWVRGAIERALEREGV